MDENNTNYDETFVIEVPSDKIVDETKETVDLTVKVKDLPWGKDDIKNLIAGVKRNGEEIKPILIPTVPIEPKTPITPATPTVPVSPANQTNLTTPQTKTTPKNEPKDKNEKEEKRKFNPKLLIPVGLVILVAIPIFVKSCDKEKTPNPNPDPNRIEETTENPSNTEPSEIEIIVIDEQEFNIKFYEIQNAYEILEGIVNSEGQEGLTANEISGERLKGSYYNDDEQFLAEEQASEGVQHFKDIKKEIDQNMQIVTDPSQSNEDKKKAIERLLELSEEIESIYNDNEDFAEEYAEKFEEASRAYQDSNTENEVIAVDGMVENLKRELGLSTHNVNQIKIIKNLLDNGFELEITEADKDLRGTYEISGKGTRKVVKKVNPNEVDNIQMSASNTYEINENDLVKLTQNVKLREANETYKTFVQYEKSNDLESGDTNER